MKTRTLVLGSTVGLAVVVAAFAFSRGALSSPRAPAPPAAAMDDEGAAENVNRQLASLRAEVASLRGRERSAEAAPPDGSARAEPSPSPATPQSLEEVQHKIEQEIAARSEVIEAQLAGEPGDRTWNAKADQAARDVVRSTLPGSQLIDIKCGATICKVSLSHTSLDDQHQVGELASHYPFDTAAIYRYHTDVVPPRTEVYFAREGATLPAPPPAQQ
jgi:hypothetical protein